ncbi:hypothetical protein LINPERPRIM_LOCUS10925, partial [Linum perenne]
MRALIWNIRGFNKNVKFKELLNFISRFNLDLVAILEPRVCLINAPDLFSARFPGWNGDFCYEKDLGKIWLLWKVGMPVTVLKKTSQFIHVLVDFVEPFLLTVVYAANTCVERRVLFADIVAFGVRGLPWLIGGDFNTFLSVEEASNQVSNFGGMDDFKDFIEKIEVSEHSVVGPWFTWTNNRVDEPIARRLDRVLVNLKWQSSFPASKVEVLASSESDHCALMVNTKGVVASKPKPFKFFSSWTRHPNFDEIVKRVWMVRSSDTPFYMLYGKLRNLKRELKVLNSEFYSDIQNRVKSKASEVSLLLME